MRTLDLLKLILDKEMELPVGRCFAYNTEVDLPKDEELFVVMSLVSKLPYSNITKHRNTENGLEQIQIMNLSEDIIISVVSKNTDARERCHEVLMALNSDYSQFMQEKEHMHISTISEIVDSSFLEATAILNRFDIRVSVIRSYEKVTSVDYYNKFSGSTWVENNYNDVLKNEV